MDEVVKAKIKLHEIVRDIQQFEASFWTEEDQASDHYKRTMGKLIHDKFLAEMRLEQAYIHQTKIDLESKKKELRSDSLCQ